MFHYLSKKSADQWICFLAKANNPIWPFPPDSRGPKMIRTFPTEIRPAYTQEIVIPLLGSISFNEVLHLYSQIVGITKICLKNLLNKLMRAHDRSYRSIFVSLRRSL